jgi:hypothetical protein
MGNRMKSFVLWCIVLVYMTLIGLASIMVAVLALVLGLLADSLSASVDDGLKMMERAHHWYEREKLR